MEKLKSFQTQTHCNLNTDIALAMQLGWLNRSLSRFRDAVTYLCNLRRYMDALPMLQMSQSGAMPRGMWTAGWTRTKKRHSKQLIKEKQH